jgi:hypothetical protein
MARLFSRRQFVRASSGLAALELADVSAPLFAQESAAQAPAHAVAESFPSQDPVLAKEIVNVSHNDIMRVRELVERQPALARASIDWGFGDWEAAIDAASHVGRRDIAELLIASGARPTIFSAAMMGQLDVIKAFVAARPGVQRSYGPHGITLLAHARAGGADAMSVLHYLTTLGDADIPLPSAPISPAERDAVAGKYAFGAGPRDYFTIDVQNDRLGIERPGAPARRLLVHLGDLVFFPTGVPSAKIAFARDRGTVTRFTIADPAVFITAMRE